MYKKIFMGIAAAAALTLVSCSNDDLNSLSDNSSKNEAISFDGYLGRSAVSVNGSRGSELTKDALQKSDEGFGVFGNYKTADGQEFGSNWFDNVQVKYSSKDTKWTYDPVQYWLPQGHIDFLAYAPRVEETKLKDNTSCIDFTVEKEVTKQKDLLWANATNQTKENIANTNNKVKFQFAHALSRLGYTVKLNNDYTGTTITLNKITLAGSKDGTQKAFYPKGTIDLSTGDWTPSTTDEKLNFEWFTNISGTVLNTEAADNAADNFLFVIPQNFSASATNKLYVIVEYTIKGYNGVTTPMTNKVYQKLEKNFLQGKAYTINLTLGLTPIEFDATVEGWTDINQGEINSWN